ncbi:MAG: cytochrome b562 [Aeromonas sp.]
MPRAIKLVWLPLLAGLCLQPLVAGELKQPMKAINSHYKAALRAADGQEMRGHIQEMKAAIDEAKSKAMPAEKKEKFLAGLNKVQAELDASLAALAAGDSEQARSHLAAVDKLKKEYHHYAKQ